LGAARDDDEGRGHRRQLRTRGHHGHPGPGRVPGADPSWCLQPTGERAGDFHRDDGRGNRRRPQLGDGEHGPGERLRARGVAPGRRHAYRSVLPHTGRRGLTFAAMSAGNNAAGGHTCGVTTSGAAYCWGRNGNGQLGDGTTTDRLVPTPVAGGATFAAVSAGGQPTCGVTPSAAAYWWGQNGAGGRGDGT